MPRHLPSLILTALCAAAVAGLAAAQQKTSGYQFHIGPIYTDQNGTQAPRFPRLDIVVELRGSENSTQVYRASEMRLVEDGVATDPALEVRKFEDTPYGVGAIVAIDASGSMKGTPLDIIRDSLYRFSSQVRAQDRVAVATFADDTRWDVPPGSSPQRLRSGLRNLAARGHYTHLYDGLLDVIRAFDRDFPARRELTVISDGHDEGSRHSLAEVIQQARQRGISIDAIGVTRSPEQYLNSLRQMAGETGGSFHKAQSDPQLQSLISGGLMRMKETPVGTFEATKLKSDGRQHRAGVMWTPPNSLPWMAEVPLTTPKASNLWTSYVPLGLLALALSLAAFLWWRKKAARTQSGAEEFERHYKYDAGDVDADQGFDRPEDGRAGAGFDRSANGGQASLASRTKTRMVHLFADVPEGAPLGWLEGIGGGLEGQRFPINRKKFWIGAAENNDLLLTDSTVSGNHACISFEAGVLMIADNHSTNGTSVNGSQLRGSKRSLSPGDLIQLGRVSLRLSREERPGERA